MTTSLISGKLLHFPNKLHMRNVRGEGVYNQDFRGSGRYVLQRVSSKSTGADNVDFSLTENARQGFTRQPILGQQEKL